jgi:hypothetical protein
MAVTRHREKKHAWTKNDIPFTISNAKNLTYIPNNQQAKLKQYCKINTQLSVAV